MASQSTSLSSDAIAEGLAEIFSKQLRLFLLGLSKSLSQENISLSQYCLLGILSGQSQMTMSDIAAAMMHTTAAATGLVDRLENVGLVRRVQSRDDRRKVWVELSDSGRAMVEEVRVLFAVATRLSLSHLTKEEGEMWYHISRKIAQYHQFS